MSLQEIVQIREHINSIIAAKSYDKPDIARQIMDDLTELDSMDLTKELISQSKLIIPIVRLTKLPKDTQVRKLATDLNTKIQQISKAARPTTPTGVKNVKAENKDGEIDKQARFFAKSLQEVYKSEYKYDPEDISLQIADEISKCEDHSARFSFLINLITDQNKDKELKFRERILKGELSPYDFVNIKKEDTYTKEEKEKQKRIDEENMNKALAPKPPSFKSKNYRCIKCKSQNVSFRQLQTRSADEPMTVFFTCGDCGYEWRR